MLSRWPPHRRRPGRAWWTGFFAVAVLASAVAVASMISTPPSGRSHHMAMPRANRTVAPALVSALRLADKSSVAAGKLPPAACEPDSVTMVTCMAPAPGITGAVFSTYPTLQALYTAYVQKARSLDSGQFRANYEDCGRSSPDNSGEVGWNLQLRHPRSYTVAQMAAGHVTDRQAAGRVFCVMAGGAVEDMVWTQDAGHLLGWVAGQPHEDVWNWWAAIHHTIAFPGLANPGGR
jgi:hypothetical protein